MKYNKSILLLNHQARKLILIFEAQGRQKFYGRINQTNPLLQSVNNLPITCVP